MRKCPEQGTLTEFCLRTPKHQNKDRLTIHSLNTDKNMNKIKTNTWILLVVGILVLITAIKVFSTSGGSGASKLTTSRVELENGGYELKYYNASGKLVKTETYDKDGKLINTVNAFSGFRL